MKDGTGRTRCSLCLGATGEGAGAAAVRPLISETHVFAARGGKDLFVQWDGSYLLERGREWQGSEPGLHRQAGFCAQCHKTTELKTDSTDPICFTLQTRLREQEKFPETRG